jgi:type I restriction enzyme S subunit
MSASARETDVPDLKAERDRWQRVSFGNVVRQVKDSVDAASSGLERYVAGEHMDTDDPRVRRWGRIGDGYLGPAFHRRFRTGQVLYGSRRTYLRKVAIPGFDGVCANTTFVCEPVDERLLPEFLLLVMQLNAFHNHSIAQSKGSVNPYINWKDLAWFEFDLPPVDVQRRLVTLLGAARLHAEALEAAAERARTAAVAQFVERVYDSVAASRVALADVLNASESGCSAPGRAEPTGHYVLGLQALTRHGYRSGQFKSVDLTEAMQRARLGRGDVLVSRSNTADRVGFAAIFDEDRGDVSFPDTMMRLRIDPKRALPEYVVLALMSPPGRRHMQRVAAGTSASMKKINRKGLGSFEFPLLPLAEQQAVIDAVAKTEQAGRAADVACVCARALADAVREELMA